MTLAGFVLAGAMAAAAAEPIGFAHALIAAHPQQSGVYVLDTGTEALLARAWLADHARESIEVQYFIWSTDNIGILAAEALLRAAERGVRVRVIVDDLLIDAPDESLLALARHPQVDIRIYNPKHSVGTPWYKRLLNVLSDFRGVNQRMHDKTFVVDGAIAIIGGRNMADEYYNYDRAYNFRDRDALLLGPVARTVRSSFENFWNSALSVPLEALYGADAALGQAQAERVYRELHAYAQAPANFDAAVRQALAAMPQAFPELARDVVWTDAVFISDRPGKNETGGLGGGGPSGVMLAHLLEQARSSVVIQSPYLVLSDEALALFRRARERGVRLRISTNSLASTDNLQAFSGYRNQRAELLALGLEIHEYRPDPQVQRELMRRLDGAPREMPVFAVHAKTLVVDAETLYIGTFNLDPRSQNLNTEIGVIVRDAGLARKVQAAIETDMAPVNSWNAASDEPDQYAPWDKRCKAGLWQLLPLRPLL